MAKIKPADIPTPDLTKKQRRSCLRRLARPEVQQGIEYALRRMGELTTLSIVKMELQQSGLSARDADVCLEAARNIVAMDPDWIEELTTHIRLGISQTIAQLSEMSDRAADDRERREILAMKLRAYDGMRKLMPEKVDMSITEKETVEQVIFDVYKVED